MATTVALPARYGIFERFTFPATDPAELDAMMQLQFEKLLPYPSEETATALQIISQTDSESTVMACAIHVANIEAFCSPLLNEGFPRRLTFRGIHIAALAPAGVVACGIWREETDSVFAIFESSRLSYVENLGPDANLPDELPRTLLRAEAAGLPIHFSSVLSDAGRLDEALTAILQAPVLAIPKHFFPADDAFDITPPQWRKKQAARKSRKKQRQRIAWAGAIYATVLLISLLGVAWENSQLETLCKQAASLQPRVDALIERQTRWKALAPAVDPQQYLVELLFQTYQSLPSPETRITRFDLARDQMVVEGEAPDAQKAIAFSEKLKASPELADFRFEAAPPILQPNEHAQFRIFGKR